MNISCIVDVASREVSFQDTYRIASYDHNVDVIHFSVEPIEDFSLDTSSIKIAAQGPNKARHDYAVDPSTVQIEEETGYITFDWPIPAGVTEMPIGSGFKYGDKGQLIFAVCAEIISGDTVSKAWHSDDGIITVVAHLEPEAGGGEDPEEEATNAQKIGQLQTDVAVINTQVGALANGSPTPVETIAEMTDESAVYLYTGSETGYTAGNWYYYDGSAWTSGGTYGGAVTDTTLSVSGAPADSKAVGDALAGKADSDSVDVLSNKIDAVIDSETVTTWEICDKDSEGFTQIPGYISSDGSVSGTTSTTHKTWYRTYSEDVDVYATRTNTSGQIRIGVYTSNVPQKNYITQYGSSGTAGTLPTEENPFHVTAGQCVAVSIYNQAVYDWVLHCATTSTTGTLKSTLSLTAQMGAEVDEKIAESAPDISNQIADISALSTDALLYLDKIPTYYTTAEESPATFDEAYSYLERRIKAIPDVSKSFVFITDTHWAGNAKHSTQLINYVRKRTGIRKVLFGGDILGNAANKYLFVKIGGAYLLESRQAFGTDFIPCVGDHDHNSVRVDSDSVHFVPEAEVYEMFMGDVKRVYHRYHPAEKLAELTSDSALTAECLAFFHTVYYVDDVKKQIRYIVLNCGCGAGYGAVYDVFGTTGMDLLRAQIPFLIESLYSTPTGYNVCVLSHKLNYGGGASNAIRRLLSDFKIKKSVSKPAPASATAAIETFWNHSTQYDFSDAPDIGLVFSLYGHTHDDGVYWAGYSNGEYSASNVYEGETLDQSTSGQIPYISTATDSIGNVEDYAGQMVAGTVTEQCFDVVTIEDDGIAFTRFGVGSDRKVFVEVGSNE